MGFKVVKGMKLGDRHDLILSFLFLLVISFVMAEFYNQISNSVAIFILILGEIIAFGIFWLFFVFAWIYRGYEFFIVVYSYKKEITPEKLESTFKSFLQGLKNSIPEGCEVRTKNKFDNLDSWFSTEKSMIMACETRFVLYIDYSVVRKNILKIGIGFRPLNKDRILKNKFIQNVEKLAKDFEPKE